MEVNHNKCIGWCDIDKYARKSYLAMYPHTRSEWNAKDIKTVTNSEWQKINRKYDKINVICGGFPCQSFSIAGKRKGFLDKTRGTLFFQIARAAKEIKPQYLFLENVKGLLNHRHGKTFATILATLDEIGYDVEWQVLNSKNFGVPQNRERVYIIGHLRGSRTQEVFHWKGQAKENPKQINLYHKSTSQDYRIYSNNGISRSVTATDYKHKPIVQYFYNARKHGNYGSTYNVLKPTGIANTLSTMQGGNREPKIAYYHKDRKHMNNRIVKSNGESPSITSTGHKPKVAIPVLTPDRVKKRQNGRRFKNNQDPESTINTSDRQGIATKNKQDQLIIRKLTPKECWRLQGFKDKYFDKAKEVCSNSQLYKQAGNAVSVPVIKWIAKRLYVY